MFWHIEAPESTRSRAAWTPGEVMVERLACIKNPNHRSGGKRLSDLSVTLAEGAVPDFVWTWDSELLVQDESLNILRKAGLSGFEPKPAKVHLAKGRRAAPKLWELRVFGWGGFAGAGSGVHLIESCEECGYQLYSCFKKSSLLLDRQQWDGSDFFIVWPLPRFIFVTDRVAEVLRRHKLSGMKLQPLEKMKCQGTLSPGNLAWYLPESKLEQIDFSLERPLRAFQ